MGFHTPVVLTEPGLEAPSPSPRLRIILCDGHSIHELVLPASCLMRFLLVPNYYVLSASSVLPSSLFRNSFMLFFLPSPGSSLLSPTMVCNPSIRLAGPLPPFLKQLLHLMGKLKCHPSPFLSQPLSFCSSPSPLPCEPRAAHSSLNHCLELQGNILSTGHPSPQAPGRRWVWASLPFLLLFLYFQFSQHHQIRLYDR